MNTIECIRQEADVLLIMRARNRITSMNGSFNNLADEVGLLGNSVRLKIMFLLYEENKLCVCDMSDILQMTVSSISQHLRKLRDGGLIKSERQAQTIYYFLEKDYAKMFKPFFKILENEKEALSK